MVAGFIKIFAPIILPITMDVADHRPIFFFNWVVDIQGGGFGKSQLQIIAAEMLSNITE
jgi:hypothetical protein